jgi:hypothetical protein
MKSFNRRQRVFARCFSSHFSSQFARDHDACPQPEARNTQDAQGVNTNRVSLGVWVNKVRRRHPERLDVLPFRFFLVCALGKHAVVLDAFVNRCGVEAGPSTMGVGPQKPKPSTQKNTRFAQQQMPETHCFVSAGEIHHARSSSCTLFRFFNQEVASALLRLSFKQFVLANWLKWHRIFFCNTTAAKTHHGAGGQTRSISCK